MQNQVNISDGADNSSGPVFRELAIEAYRAVGDDIDDVNAVTGRVLVAQSPEAFTYDADGNMTSDGRFRYTWNAENRLVRAEELYAPTNREPYATRYDYVHRGKIICGDISRGGAEDRMSPGPMEIRGNATSNSSRLTYSI